jgi:sulfate transport system substrate-binding protein
MNLRPFGLWKLASSFTAMLLLSGLTGCGSHGEHELELLNASYDPTRELWRDLNTQFAASYQRETGRRLTIRQSHGGSTSQARAIQ